MIVPLSRLRRKIVHDVVLAVEQARAELAGVHQIVTESPTIAFTVEVFVEDLGYVEGDETMTIQPETETRQESGPQVTRQRQAEEISTEEQETTPGVNETTQAFGRSSTTEVEEVA